MPTLPILHWNDVYRVNPQKVTPTSSETIDVTQFAAMVDAIRNRWVLRPDGKRDGLALFSGDVFSPSVESSVTRGSHMVPVMNELAPDVSLTGNHEFDFGYPHLCKLIQDTHFPWVLSNIIDNKTLRVPENLHEFQVLERVGLRIGVIGLVEQEWIATVSSWPSNFEYRDMEQVGRELSKRLRDSEGEYRCDIIIALTHARVPNDISLAKRLFALSPKAQLEKPIASSHGVDLILGGHDHLYYIGKGVTSWDNFDLGQPVLGAEDDEGDVLVIKSGTDFRDLSEFTLELEPTPPGSIRKHVIKKIEGKRHVTKPGSESSEKLAKILKTLLGSVSSALKASVCKAIVGIDLRSQYIRTAESAAGNWFADVIRHAYDDALILKGCGGSDGVLICAGTLRGDSIYGPGNITLGDIMEILPFDDPIVVLELDGAAIWAALESALNTWPAQEGRFPIVSGLRVSWDSHRPSGQRVLGVWLQKDAWEGTPNNYETNSGDVTPKNLEGEEVRQEKGGRKYNIVTREYMAQGFDGYLALKGQKYLVDDEQGQLMSGIVRKYLLGSHFVKKMARLSESPGPHLHTSTQAVISREVARRGRDMTVIGNPALNQLKQAARRALRWSRSKTRHRDYINVTAKEHMSNVDCFDGTLARGGSGEPGQAEVGDEDLLVINPVVDGRMRDIGRSE